jgi:DNA-directed RNA polymerase specialized sigma24 family protein
MAGVVRGVPPGPGTGPTGGAPAGTAFASENTLEQAMNKSLTDEVVAYNQTGEGWEELSRRIYLYVYAFPAKWTNWDEDRCSDFFLSFLPRIPALVRRYRPEYSFETYLSCCLRWYMKTCLEQRAGQEHYDRWCAEISQEEAGQKMEIGADPSHAPPDDKYLGPFKVDEKGALKDSTLRQRVLFAVLLGAADVDDHRIPFIARLTGTDEDRLRGLVIRSRELVAEKIERRRRLRERRNECWYRLDGARHRAESACDSGRRETWRKTAGTWEHRHAAACAGIRRLNMTPTHHDIGRMLEVPPGTVSSGLHFLRKAWRKMDSIPPTG